ncbi:MAG TPA: hypothetical protein VMC85_12260 [Desulfomonilaceae bacterium]|nr:hypothetical protein [Desulfomonilaceae bacterium]
MASAGNMLADVKEGLPSELETEIGATLCGLLRPSGSRSPVTGFYTPVSCH